MEKSKAPDLRDRVVKLRDDHEVEHSVRLRSTSVYEAALRGFLRQGIFKIPKKPGGSIC
jgi:hypothetical protein